MGKQTKKKGFIRGVWGNPLISRKGRGKKKKTEIEAQDNQEPAELKISRKQGFFLRTCSLDPSALESNERPRVFIQLAWAWVTCHPPRGQHFLTVLAWEPQWKVFPKGIWNSSTRRKSDRCCKAKITGASYQASRLWPCPSSLRPPSITANDSATL